jgi:hypothetical protein
VCHRFPAEPIIFAPANLAPSNGVKRKTLPPDGPWGRMGVIGWRSMPYARPPRSGLVQRKSSPAGAARYTFMSPEIGMAAPIICNAWNGPGHLQRFVRRNCYSLTILPLESEIRITFAQPLCFIRITRSSY